MVLELLGSRILAPSVGSSLVSWTALISIVLAGLAIGYVWGGKRADASRGITPVVWLLIVAAIAIGLIPWIDRALSSLILSPSMDVRVEALILAGGLFFIPSVLLGSVVPFLAKHHIHSLTTTGRSVGELWALSAGGNIVGTIGAGFILIPNIEYPLILWGLSGILLLNALMLAVWWKTDRQKTSMIVTIVLMCLGVFRVDTPDYIIETPYHRVSIVDTHDSFYATGRPVRYLKTDRFGAQSGMYLDEPSELAIPYMEYFRLAHAFTPDMRRVLMIGAAGYASPKDFLHRYPDVEVDVVEIDPGMTRIAREYFALPQTDRLKTYHMDGRVFLRKSQSVYDAIIVDAFAGAMEIPPHLVTAEAFVHMAGRLTGDGTVIVNVTSPYGGARSVIASSILATMESVFPVVSAYAVQYPANSAMVQNVILIGHAQAQSASGGNAYDTHRVSVGKHPEANILTDAHSPMEYYSMKLLVE